MSIRQENNLPGEIIEAATVEVFRRRQRTFGGQSPHSTGSWTTCALLSSVILSAVILRHAN